VILSSPAAAIETGAGRTPSDAAISPTRGRPTESWRTADPDLLANLREEITTLSARVYSETQRLLALIAEFDRLEGWRLEGFASCADWLAYNARLDKITAREKVRVARALSQLPETSAAMARGELSFSQARALTRVADADSEEDLLGHASTMSAAALERLVRSWKRPDRRDGAVAEDRRHAARRLSVFPDDDGSYLLRGRLDPEVGALLMRAIEAAGDALYQGSVPAATPEQRRADALGLLVERAMATIGRGAGRAERYLVVVHVDDATLSSGGQPGRPSLEDGTRVSAETSRRVACDATAVRATGDDSPVVTARTRTVPPRMRRALEIRDRGCRFPGCGSRFTDAHHVRHWADGGPTRLENLVLLCGLTTACYTKAAFAWSPTPGVPDGPTSIAREGFASPTPHHECASLERLSEDRAHAGRKTSRSPSIWVRSTPWGEWPRHLGRRGAKRGC
jgi:hypothetical protein